MENLWALLALVYAALLTFLISKLFYKRRPERKLPPGPKPWPIIGNLNLVGSVPHQSLHLLAQKYGEIMQLKFGKFPVVVASSPEMAKQFLKVHDMAFAARPALAAGKYTSYNYMDMAWAPYGPFWRQARKPVVLRDHLCRHTLSTISRMVLGRKYFSESGDDKSSIVKLDELQAMMDEWFLLNGCSISGTGYHG
ncbi:UNVERIFIED_CONTAM: Flavonoid 3'-monooxygenase [Sesamum latifolium]|uniref:Flavonoid 3'-monooxygenase n=1 Tax=Sesamum latifolium TaxID=2727402 RepID=A0AAW2WZ22_9LAMI